MTHEVCIFADDACWRFKCLVCLFFFFCASITGTPVMQRLKQWLTQLRQGSDANITVQYTWAAVASCPPVLLMVSLLLEISCTSTTKNKVIISQKHLVNLLPLHFNFQLSVIVPHQWPKAYRRDFLFQAHLRDTTFHLVPSKKQQYKAMTLSHN